MQRLRTILKWAAPGLVALLVAIQFVPYGRDHKNPPGGRQIAWDSPRTERLMTDACMDCHSNLTKWPWYSNVAPISWLVQNDVDEGRRRLNLSTGDPELEEMIDAIRDGSMPPWQYKPAHPGARLSDQEKRELIRGLQATFGGARGAGADGATEARSRHAWYATSTKIRPPRPRIEEVWGDERDKANHD